MQFPTGDALFRARLTGKQAHAALAGRSQHVEERYTIRRKHALLQPQPTREFHFTAH
jgi:hypothetical protein